MKTYSISRMAFAFKLSIKEKRDEIRSHEHEDCNSSRAIFPIASQSSPITCAGAILIDFMIFLYPSDAKTDTALGLAFRPWREGSALRKGPLRPSTSATFVTHLSLISRLTRVNHTAFPLQKE